MKAVRPLVGFRETFLRDTASERSASTPKAKFTLVECLRFVFFGLYAHTYQRVQLIKKPLAGIYMLLIAVRGQYGARGRADIHVVIKKVIAAPSSEDSRENT